MLYVAILFTHQLLLRFLHTSHQSQPWIYAIMFRIVTLADPQCFAAASSPPTELEHYGLQAIHGLADYTTTKSEASSSGAMASTPFTAWTLPIPTRLVLYSDGKCPEVCIHDEGGHCRLNRPVVPCILVNCAMSPYQPEEHYQVHDGRVSEIKLIMFRYF